MTRRALVAATVVISWLAGSTLGSIVGLPEASARSAGMVFGRAHGGYTPEPTGRRTITILAIGSDARFGQNPLRSRADSIHVIFLHPRKGHAVVVGIPRDSWVSIPGLGANKINAAMASGGPARMVQTVESNFGARIDYWAVTSFWGIGRMVDQVGGLQVRIPFRMRDPFSGSNFHRGFQR
ncbi:MAG TPA: LCP family protein, partial [Actinomycetota bacterium]|nr:LCP family protein [Actinomycetota bacterium]